MNFRENAEKYNKKTIREIFPKMSLDSFGRLRVSNLETIFNYYPSPLTANSSIDEDILVVRNSVAGSSVTYSTSNYINLNITSNSSYALVHSKQPMDYQPGKSRLFFFTGTPIVGTIAGTFNANIGFFDVDTSTPPANTSGTYFRTDGTNLQFADTTQTGTTIVNQSSWNIDTFNGSGPSGQTLTISSAQNTMLIFFDQAWLGVGLVRCGFVINDTLYYAHQFTHSGYTVQYTPTPRQRMMYYLQGTTVSTSLSTYMMCCSCSSEAGFFPLGKRNSITTTSSGVSLTTAGTEYLVFALRLQSTYINGTLKVLAINVSFNAGSSKDVIYTLQMHSTYGSIGTISGTLTYSQLKDSIAEYVVGSGSQTVTSDGYIISSGSAASNTSISFSRNNFETLLGRTICTRGNLYYDTIVLTASSSSANTFICVGLDFIESI